MWRFLAIILICSIGNLAGITSVAFATKPSIGCANVRCAGLCQDTPAGPVCVPVSTCASTLCEQGTLCVETPRGAQCQIITDVEQPESNPTCRFKADRRQTSYTRGGWKRHNYNYHQGYGRQSGQYRHYRQARPVQAPVPSEPVFCTQHYDPVCAEKPVQCVTTPCPPVRQTFGNLCEAERDGYKIVYKGVCK